MFFARNVALPFRCVLTFKKNTKKKDDRVRPHRVNGATRESDPEPLPTQNTKREAPIVDDK